MSSASSVHKFSPAQEGCFTRFVRILNEVKDGQKQLIIQYPAGSAAVSIMVVSPTYTTTDSVPLDLIMAAHGAEKVFNMPFTAFMKYIMVDQVEAMGARNLSQIIPTFFAESKEGECRVSAAQFTQGVIMQIKWALVSIDNHNLSRRDKLDEMWASVSGKSSKADIDSSKSFMPETVGWNIQMLRDFPSKVNQYLVSTAGGKTDLEEEQQIKYLCGLSQKHKLIYETEQARFSKIGDYFSMARDGYSARQIEAFCKFAPGGLADFLKSVGNDTYRQFLEAVSEARDRHSAPASAPAAFAAPAPVAKQLTFMIKTTALQHVISSVFCKGEHDKGSKLWSSDVASISKRLTPDQWFELNHQLHDLAKTHFEKELTPLDFFRPERREIKRKAFDELETTKETLKNSFNLPGGFLNTFLENFHHNLLDLVSKTIIHDEPFPGWDGSWSAFFASKMDMVTVDKGIDHACVVQPDEHSILKGSLSPVSFELAVSILQSVYKVISGANVDGMDFLGLINIANGPLLTRVMGMFKESLTSKCCISEDTDTMDIFWHDTLFVALIALKTNVADRSEFNACLKLTKEEPTFVRIDFDLMHPKAVKPTVIPCGGGVFIVEKPDAGMPDRNLKRPREDEVMLEDMTADEGAWTSNKVLTRLVNLCIQLAIDADVTWDEALANRIAATLKTKTHDIICRDAVLDVKEHNTTPVTVLAKVWLLGWNEKIPIVTDGFVSTLTSSDTTPAIKIAYNFLHNVMAISLAAAKVDPIPACFTMDGFLKLDHKAVLAAWQSGPTTGILAWPTKLHIGRKEPKVKKGRTTKEAARAKTSKPKAAATESDVSGSSSESEAGEAPKPRSSKSGKASKRKAKSDSESDSSSGSGSSSSEDEAQSTDEEEGDAAAIGPVVAAAVEPVVAAAAAAVEPVVAAAKRGRPRGSTKKSVAGPPAPAGEAGAAPIPNTRGRARNSKD